MAPARAVLLTSMSVEVNQQIAGYAPDDVMTTMLANSATDEEKIAALADADFLLIHPGDISDAVLRSAKHLKLVQLLRVGYERVNLDLLRALRIPFAITSDAFSGMVADHAVMLMLAVSRNLMASDRGVRAGRWYQPLVGKRSYEMADKVVGIVGLGHIGRQVAQRVQGFGCRVQYYGHHPLSPEDERALDVRAVSLPELFATSDIVSLHVPITPLTRRMVGAAELRLMKPSAILVNTSRGEVIDEPALIAALKAHAIAGAGLDVFDPQPPVADNPLLQMDNVVLTPHSASDTVERWSRTARFVWRNVAMVRDGGTPVGLITA
jgi:phosphoglycerate dehydrogenase-like enzyme